MVGLCGAVGDVGGDVVDLVDGLTWIGGEVTASSVTDDVAVGVATHLDVAEPQPARASQENVTIWLWGTTWGFDGHSGYETADASPAAYVARLYDQCGMGFISGLNGSFAGLVHDHDANRVALFTDRLGTRPVHYAQTNNGLVFSTDIQSLPRHQAVAPTFNIEYLAEYFTLQRSFGLKTPLADVQLLPPGSVTTVDLNSWSVETSRYWEPEYSPQDRSRSYFVRQLSALIKQIAEERTCRDATYGLLLSGGSDSRLTLAALTAAGRSVHCYHLNEWENREASIARQTAAAANVDYTFLRRDSDYTARALEATPPIANFVGYFNQVHAAGYADRLRQEVDALVTGHYGDMLFKGNHFPTPTVGLGEVGSFDVPVMQRVRTISDLIDQRVGPRTAPAFINEALNQSIREVYAANVEHCDGYVIDHGVGYQSLKEAVIASRCPLSNGTSQFFYQGTLQMMPSWTPFLDNRLIDLFLSTPVRYLLRGGLVGGALKRLAPDLAAVPHASTSVSPSRPFAAQRLGRVVTGFARRHLVESPSEPHWTHGPWPDHGELIRTHDFVRETLDEHKDQIRALPFLEEEGVDTCYQAHLDGAHNLAALYSLVTFLKMPAVEMALSEERVQVR